MKYIYAALMLLSFSLTAHAAAIAKLTSFIAATHSAKADFTQEVFDQTGRRIQRSSGIMQFQRPGKFRWTYQKPYEQLIVGDGEKFWLYDTDLNQVTVRKLDAALGSSPAALLSGSNEIEQGFTLTEDGSRDRLEWLLAIPKAQDSGFEKIRMAFDAQAGLAIMELYDSFGNKTLLKFSAMQRNPDIPDRLFRFTPPKDADVLSD
jgi:chaperone LolA